MVLGGLVSTWHIILTGAAAIASRESRAITIRIFFMRPISTS